MALDRILRGTGATASCPFFEDGAIVDPGTVTLTITREDGTVIAAAQATSGSGAAARTFNLTAATHTASLDVLTLDWLSATKGTLTTYVEIRGGFLFSTAQARAKAPLNDTTTYPLADLYAARVAAEDALEDACGVAFVPTYAREVRNGNGSCDLLPKRRRPLSVESATISSSDVTASVEIDDEDGPSAATFYREAGWTAGRRNVELKYTAGYESPPPYVAEGALALLRAILVDSPVDPRASSITGEDGTVQLLTADGVFGIPAADRVVSEYGLRGDVA